MHKTRQKLNVCLLIFAASPFLPAICAVLQAPVAGLHPGISVTLPLQDRDCRRSGGVKGFVRELDYLD